MIRYRWIGGLFFLLAGLIAASCSRQQPEAGKVLDEAKQAGRDGGVVPARRTRTTSTTWTAASRSRPRRSRAATCGWSGAAATTASGTRMTDYTFGAFDLLKIVSSHPSLGYSRDQPLELPRPGQRAVLRQARPAPTRIGAASGSTCAARTAPPIRSRTRASIPASRSARAASRWATARRSRSARTTATPPASSACACSPIPTSTRRRPRTGMPRSYYTDPDYYNRKDLVRPYRVGMSCGFCHVGPSPVKPPADPEHPTFANLSSSVGAQYMWVDRLFIFNSNKPEGRKNFMYQLAHTFRPGSMDTSLVSTDGINNPRTMNAVYDFGPRMGMAKRIGTRSSPAANSTTSSSTTSSPAVR